MAGAPHGGGHGGAAAVAAPRLGCGRERKRQRKKVKTGYGANDLGVKLDIKIFSAKIYGVKVAAKSPPYLR